MEDIDKHFMVLVRSTTVSGLATDYILNLNLNFISE